LSVNSTLEEGYFLTTGATKFSGHPIAVQNALHYSFRYLLFNRARG
jgi:hypothetical protein